MEGWAVLSPRTWQWAHPIPLPFQIQGRASPRMDWPVYSLGLMLRGGGPGQLDGHQNFHLGAGRGHALSGNAGKEWWWGLGRGWGALDALSPWAQGRLQQRRLGTESQELGPAAVGECLGWRWRLGRVWAGGPPLHFPLPADLVGCCSPQAESRYNLKLFLPSVGART